MTRRFRDAVAVTLRHEGGYVNDPADPGGETNFGISKRSYPGVDIRRLTRDAAMRIYYRDFWGPHHYEEYPAGVGEKVFDLGVNMGVRQAQRLLQHALNDIGERLTVDGFAGPITRAAIARQQTSGDGALLLQTLRLRACGYYADLVGRRPTSLRFLRGWILRTLE